MNIPLVWLKTWTLRPSTKHSSLHCPCWSSLTVFSITEYIEYSVALIDSLLNILETEFGVLHTHSQVISPYRIYSAIPAPIEIPCIRRRVYRLLVPLYLVLSGIILVYLYCGWDRVIYYTIRPDHRATGFGVRHYQHLTKHTQIVHDDTI